MRACEKTKMLTTTVYDLNRGSKKVINTVTNGSKIDSIGRCEFLRVVRNP
jgi:hypothetical protein